MNTKQSHMRIYGDAGQRLYINRAERLRFIEAANGAQPHIKSFALTLLHTGCRISEALELQMHRVQFETGRITFRTLKRRAPNIFREVPIPPELVAALTLQLNRGGGGDFIWQEAASVVNRSTGFRWIKSLMSEAQIMGSQSSPKGLRHGFAMHALESDVPLNMVSKWLGHASIETTRIYTNACGHEEMAFANRMWSKDGGGQCNPQGE